MRTHTYITGLIFALTYVSAQPLMANSEKTRVGLLAGMKTDVIRAEKRLTVGDDIFLKDLVRTNETGISQFQFTDRSSAKLGPNSSIEFSDEILDIAGRKASIAARMISGVARFTGSDSSKTKPIVVQTPNMALGVLGGIVEIGETDDGTFQAELISGRMICQSDVSQKMIRKSGFACVVDETGRILVVKAENDFSEILEPTEQDENEDGTNPPQGATRPEGPDETRCGSAAGPNARRCSVSFGGYPIPDDEDPFNPVTEDGPAVERIEGGDETPPQGSDNPSSPGAPNPDGDEGATPPSSTPPKEDEEETPKEEPEDPNEEDDTGEDDDVTGGEPGDKEEETPKEPEDPNEGDDTGEDDDVTGGDPEGEEEEETPKEPEDPNEGDDMGEDDDVTGGDPEGEEEEETPKEEPEDPNEGDDMGEDDDVTGGDPEDKEEEETPYEPEDPNEGDDTGEDDDITGRGPPDEEEEPYDPEDPYEGDDTGEDDDITGRGPPDEEEDPEDPNEGDDMGEDEGTGGDIPPQETF